MRWRMTHGSYSLVINDILTIRVEAGSDRMSFLDLRSVAADELESSRSTTTMPVVSRELLVSKEGGHGRYGESSVSA